MRPRLEQHRRLARRPPQHVTHDQYRPLPRREDLQRREEGELDRLPADDSGVRLVVASRHLVEQAIRVGLEPGDLGERVQRRRPARAPPEDVEADVRRDAVQPRSEQRAAALEAVAPAPGPQKRLLHGVLGFLERSEHPVAVNVQLAPVPLGEGGEGRGGLRLGPMF